MVVVDSVAVAAGGHVPQGIRDAIAIAERLVLVVG
jgi:hypothetical protein